MFCPNCGTQLADKDTSCPKCGQRVNLVFRAAKPQNPYAQSSSAQQTPDTYTPPKISRASPNPYVQQHFNANPTPYFEAPIAKPASGKFLPTIIFYAPLLLAGISIALCMFNWVYIHIPVDFGIPFDFDDFSFAIGSNALSLATMLEYFMDDKEPILFVFRVMRILVFVAASISFIGCILMAKPKAKHRMLLIIGQLMFIIVSLGFIIAMFKTNTWIASTGSGSSDPYQSTLSFTPTPAAYLCLASASISIIFSLIGKNK